MTVGVIFGGPSPEHDISILTGLLALREVARSSDAIGLYWSKAGAFFAVPPTIEASDFADGLPGHAEELHFRVGPHGGFMGSGRLGREKPKDLSAVIVATHGGPGEDGTLQGMLDAVGIPYSGPSVAGAALGMDKWAFGAVVAAAGLPTLPRVLLTSDLREVPFPGPYIVKPRFGGSSIGIEVVADLATAVARLSHNEHWSRGAVLEPYRDDLRDVQIALRTYPTLTLSAIEKPIRRTANAAILNYHDKYVGGEGMVSAPRELPAVLPGQQSELVRHAATVIASAASVRGVARIDFLANDSELFVNEINTIPGSLSKHLFVDPVVPFASLLNDLLAEARERPPVRYSSLGADGTVLRGAGAIAAKLA